MKKKDVLEYLERKKPDTHDIIDHVRPLRRQGLYVITDIYYNYEQAVQLTHFDIRGIHFKPLTISPYRTRGYLHQPFLLKWRTFKRYAPIREIQKKDLLKYINHKTTVYFKEILSNGKFSSDEHNALLHDLLKAKNTMIRRTRKTIKRSI